MTTTKTCGSLVIGGIPGATLPDRFARDLREGRRGGVVLFRRNVEGGLDQIAALARQVHAAAPQPLLAVDQEGGRVARLRSPLLRVPPMRTVASWRDLALAEGIAHAVGSELAALGITFNLAPVLDVDTRPDNPVIGDRSFGSDPAECARFGAAWIRGLQRAGVGATGKHFPGHGDTTVDSHFDLPTIDHAWDRLERVEWPPFRAAVEADAWAMMSAHVVARSIDDARPATISPKVLSVLRRHLGFGGVLFSDDLEMLALASFGSPGEIAVAAVAAGCDALLICRSEEKQDAALEALIAEADRSPSFRARCEEAARRVQFARSRSRAVPVSDADLPRYVGGPASLEVAAEIERRGARPA